MSRFALEGRVVAGDRVLEGGHVLVEDGEIAAVGSGTPECERLDFSGCYLVPGFVDLQVNGAFGIDVATMPERVPELSARLTSTGVTSYLPTLISRPLEEYLPLIARIQLAASGARPLGLHLEGPFLNPKMKGAHPEDIALPNPEALKKILSTGCVRLITLAPEMYGADGLTEVALKHGAVVSLGHSRADFRTAYSAFEAGAAGVTHLFNAMSPLHHREPGLPGAAFAHPRAVCGLIADGGHVHPEMVRLAYRLLGPHRLCLVTDAIAAAGMGDGEYPLAGRRVGVRDGVARLEDGTLAGSVLSMHEALRNVVEAGCALPEAVRMASTTPAVLVGGTRKGILAAGCDADVVVLTPELGVHAVWVGGERVYG